MSGRTMIDLKADFGKKKTRSNAAGFLVYGMKSYS